MAEAEVQVRPPLNLKDLKKKGIRSMKLKEKVELNFLVDFVYYVPNTKDFIIGYDFKLRVFDGDDFTFKKHLHKCSSFDNVQFVATKNYVIFKNSQRFVSVYDKSYNLRDLKVVENHVDKMFFFKDDLVILIKEGSCVFQICDISKREVRSLEVHQRIGVNIGPATSL